jgi:hypothetical protein
MTLTPQGEIDIVFTGTDGCAVCGEPLDGDTASVFDPNQPHLGAVVVHADYCYPKGWEQA